MTQSFEERFDEKFYQNEKRVWLSYSGESYESISPEMGRGELFRFIRQEKELSRKEGYEEGYQAGRDSIFNQGGLVFLSKGPKAEDLNETI